MQGPWTGSTPYSSQMYSSRAHHCSYSPGHRHASCLGATGSGHQSKARGSSWAACAAEQQRSFSSSQSSAYNQDSTDTAAQTAATNSRTSSRRKLTRPAAAAYVTRPDGGQLQWDLGEQPQQELYAEQANGDQHGRQQPQQEQLDNQQQQQQPRGRQLHSQRQQRRHELVDQTLSEQPSDSLQQEPVPPRQQQVGQGRQRQQQHSGQQQYRQQEPQTQRMQQQHREQSGHGWQQQEQQQWQQRRQQQQGDISPQHRQQDRRPQQQQRWQKPQQQQQQQQRQPPPLLFQGGSNRNQDSEPDPHEVYKLLISKISRSEDLPQIQQNLQLHEAAVDPVIISAVVSRLAKLYPGKLTQPHQHWQQRQQRQQQQQDEGSDQPPRQHLAQQIVRILDPLLHLFVTDIDRATIIEISCIVGGLARLGYDDCYDVISACVDVSRDFITDERTDNKVLLQLGWGLARIGHKPDDDWIQIFEADTLTRMPTFNNIETANSLWIFAKWGVKPSEQWLTAFLNHIPSQLLNLRPAEICSIFWATAMLQLQLPTNVLDSLLLEAQVKFGGFTGQGFGTLAWSLARMDLKPKRMWIQDFVRHSGTVLPALSQHNRDQGFTNILWALGCWEHMPPQQWLQDYCRCVVPQLQHMTPQGLTIVAVGLAELRHKPPTPFTCYLLELFHQKLPTAAVKESASFIWSLPRLLLPETLSAAVAAAGDEQQQQRDVGNVGIATAGWLRQYCWLLQDIADHLLPGLEKLSFTDLVDSISGFADLGFFPGVPWMDAHEVNLNRLLDSLTTVQINIVRQAYVRLEQIQQQQEQLLHPEQLKLLQQQQRVAAVAAGKVPSGPRWQSRSLAASAAAAAAATAAGSSIGLDPAAAIAKPQDGRSSGQNSRLRVPAWAASSSSSDTPGKPDSSRGHGRGRGRGRGRKHTNFDQEEDRGLSIGFGREPDPVMPKRPRAARIRIQKIREAEKEQRQRELEEWRQRFQQTPKGQRWRVARPEEIADDD